MKKQIKTALIIIAAMFIASCGGPEKTGKVVVRVNGEAIYMAELKTNIISMFGMEREPSIQGEQRKKILESMVLSRLIKQQAEKDLTKEILSSINRQSDIYKERLIVNQYLKKNISIPNASDAMIKEYYEKHADEFSNRKVQEYELLTTNNAMGETSRNKMLKDYAELSKGLDISAVYKSLNKKGHSLVYRKGLQNKDLTQPSLIALVRQLNNKETSKLSFIDGRPYIVKIASHKSLPAISLAEAKLEIAGKISPMMMKQAIQDKYTELKSTSEIEYVYDK